MSLAFKVPIRLECLMKMDFLFLGLNNQFLEDMQIGVVTTEANANFTCAEETTINDNFYVKNSIASR